MLKHLTYFFPRNKNNSFISSLLIILILMFFSNCKTADKTKRLADKTFASTDSSFNYTIQKTGFFNNGVVVSAHPLASMAGQEVLAKGGNAFDAAIATQLALAVVYPNAGNLGGGGFMVAQMANGKTLALDYREKAPAAATKNMYIDKDGKANTNKSQNGHLAAGIPGTVAGIFETLPYAKLPLKQLIAPALHFAKNGFAITEREAYNLNALKEEFKNNNLHTPAVIKNTLWQAKDTLIQNSLANTLVAIEKNGKAGFYEGIVANYIVTEMKKGGGIISYEDLKNYKATWRSVHKFKYRDYEILTMPPPSSGGIILHQLLSICEDYPLGSYNFQSTKAMQLIIEAERLAYADRATYLGDPDFVKVPIKTLTAKNYLNNRMKDFAFGKVGNSQITTAGTIKESEETTHISIVDKEGNAVAITTTLNGSYGSKTFVEGAGFLLNNEMDDFSIMPGVPNMYGAIGGAANSIAPGKTMLSSMTPTIVLQNSKPKYIIGTPGGTTIPTSVFQTVINLIDFKLSPTEAVWAPKFHHQWFPDEVFVEKSMETTTYLPLQQMGYKITPRQAIGRTELIVINANGYHLGVADTRGDDHVSGNNN
jgi:gamma-glutamyltranspeptidase / glutathione hydrolase